MSEDALLELCDWCYRKLTFLNTCYDKVAAHQSGWLLVCTFALLLRLPTRHRMLRDILNILQHGSAQQYVTSQEKFLGDDREASQLIETWYF